MPDKQGSIEIPKLLEVFVKQVLRYQFHILGSIMTTTLIKMGLSTTTRQRSDTPVMMRAKLLQ